MCLCRRCLCSRQRHGTSSGAAEMDSAHFAKQCSIYMTLRRVKCDNRASRRLIGLSWFLHLFIPTLKSCTELFYCRSPLLNCLHCGCCKCARYLWAPCYQLLCFLKYPHRLLFNTLQIIESLQQWCLMQDLMCFNLSTIVWKQFGLWRANFGIRMSPPPFTVSLSYCWICFRLFSYFYSRSFHPISSHTQKVSLWKSRKKNDKSWIAGEVCQCVSLGNIIRMLSRRTVFDEQPLKSCHSLHFIK